MLVAMLSPLACEIHDLGVISDKQEDIDLQFTQTKDAHDILITTGGVSMGDLDLIKPYMDKHGKVLFGRLNMKPGKPTTFARLGDCLVFALPGNPVSAFVTAQMFLPLAISCLNGG